VTADSVPAFAQPTFLEVTDEDRREACRELGHEYVDSGVDGLLEIICCKRCGALQRYRGGVR
jgi:hypothetical protein